MNLWFRLLRVALVSLLRRRLGLMEVSTLDFRVWPTDLDFNLHMTNARYLALMDLGRMDLILRTGLWKPVVRQKWAPVIGGTVVRFRRPLRAFQPVRLSSRMVSWDERWIYIEHRLESKGRAVCHALVRGAFVAPDGTLPPQTVATASGFTGAAPSLPDWAESWKGLDDSLTLATS